MLGACTVQAFFPSSAASTTMERAPPLLVVLLCAAFFTAAASASNFPPFLARGGSASAATAGPFAKKQKAKVIDKYVAKLHPPKRDGKLIGDKGASGRCATKAVMYSSTSYAYVSLCKAFKLDSGGKPPASGNMRSCNGSSGVQGDTQLPWVNITQSGQKRYSFKLRYIVKVKTLAEVRAGIALDFENGDYQMLGHQNNAYALCGKFEKVI
ncbi:unnamed protein product [Closterium sp. Yama58-4]|nr:unnamed protein product [Closterium sp. Yama58-4]